MLVVKLMGGLGNQMFQYAFGYALSRARHEVVKYDLSAFSTDPLRSFQLNNFDVDVEVASPAEIESLTNIDVLSRVRRLLGRIVRYPVPTPKSYLLEPLFTWRRLERLDSAYLEGYWQKYEYFEEHREDLLGIFRPKGSLNLTVAEIASMINGSDSISLHVRRGDYISNDHTNSVHGTCGIEYYRSACEHFRTHIDNPVFFVFSDDLEWAKSNLRSIGEMYFVDLKGECADHEEIHLMSLCNHNIVANSSFSWWGAWLNQNLDKVVVAPSQWFADSSYSEDGLIPPSWKRI